MKNLNRYLIILILGLILASFSAVLAYGRVLSLVVGQGTQASCTEAALETALAAGGNITFNCGSSPVTIIITTEKQVLKNSSLDGGGLVTLDGQNAVRILYVNKNETSGLTFNLSNITLKNGISNSTKDPNMGGCMFIRNAIVGLEKVTFTACRAAKSGAAIRNLRGKLTVTNSTFNDNQAVEGSGIFADTGSATTVTDSNFNNNTADNNGAGIFIYNAGLTITNSIFDKNKATGSVGGATPGLGGGLYTQTGNPITVKDSTFTNNFALEGGGVFADTNSTMTILNSTFTGNNATKRGGGLDTYKGVVTVSYTIFNNNSSSSGGAIHNGTTNKLTLTRLTFTGNTSQNHGGAIQNSDGNWTITDSFFSSNQAGTVITGSLGGAVVNFGGTAKVENSTFLNNEVKGTGSFGGALASNTNLTAINCTFTGNKAVSGGAVYANANTLTIQNSTLAGNVATDKGGAVRQSKGAIANFQNSILANNSPTNCSASVGTITDGGYNLQFGDSSCFANQTPANPLLGTLKDNSGATMTMELGVGSAAIDKANSAICPTTDQRGAARMGVCDIGAFEFGGTLNNPPTPTMTATKPASTPVATVTATLTATKPASTPVATATMTATKPASTPTITKTPLVSHMLYLPIILKF